MTNDFEWTILTEKRGHLFYQKYLECAIFFIECSHNEEKIVTHISLAQRLHILSVVISH